METVDEQVAVLQLEFASVAVEVESVKPVVASEPSEPASQPAFFELELQVVESVEPVASEPEPAS